MLPCILALAPGLIAPAQVREEPPFELPAGVRVEADVVYARIGARDLHLDLYLPTKAPSRMPAVVYIHGGGWQNGIKRAFRRQAADMAAKGFAGACIEYRLSGEAKFPAAVHDSKTAVRWVRSNAARYPNRIGAAGASAGGHLTAMLGTTAGVADLEGDAAGVSSGVRAVAAFNPALDLKKKYEDAGARAELFTADGAAHGFFNRPPWFEPTLRRMEEFFRAALVK